MREYILNVHVVGIYIIIITAPTIQMALRVSPRLIFGDGAAPELLAAEPSMLLWLALEADAATVGAVCAVGDGDGVDAPGNNVDGAVGAKVALMALKEDDAAAASVATADKTVVTIYVVKDSISYI